MYVEISLFKTTFDEENIFVGNNKNDMETVLNSFPSDKRKDLPRSPFNLKYPFRIAVNYFEVSRKYNYARYKFFNTQVETTPVEIRYYFIRDYLSIDDTSCEIVVREDILAKIFYDLQYPEILPDRYTYKWGDIDYLNFDISDFKSTRFEYLYSKYFNLQKVPLYTTATVAENKAATQFEYLGLIIVSITTNNLSDTIISNTSYPILTILLPFEFTENEYFNIGINNFGVIDNNNITTSIVGIGNLKDLFKQYENGFKVISTNISFNIGGYFDLERVSDKGQLNFKSNNNIELEAYELNGLKFMRLRSIKNNTGGTVPLQYQESKDNIIKYYNFGSYLDDEEEQFRQSPFYNITIEQNNEENIINPLYYKAFNSVQFYKSFIPPYTCAIIFTAPQSISPYNNNRYDDKVAIIINDDIAFINYTDAYTEFLRNNYNSLIIGQEVRHSYEWGQYGIKQSADLLKNTANITANFLSGRASGKAQAATSIAKSIINPVEDAALLGLNQAKENALLNLILEDKKNAANSVNIVASLSELYNEKTFIKINITKNIALNTYKENIKRYGVKAPYRIKNIKAHENFDYIRITDIIFNNDSIALSENERQAVEKYFNDGVRLWYDYEAYKDFTLDNPELLS